MIILGFEIRLRIPTPIVVRRVKPYWCADCDRYSNFTRNVRCPKCWRPLRRVWP